MFVHKEYLQCRHEQFFYHFKSQPYLLLLNQHYIILVCMFKGLTKTCKILHCIYRNIYDVQLTVHRDKFL